MLLLLDARRTENDGEFSPRARSSEPLALFDPDRFASAHAGLQSARSARRVQAPWRGRRHPFPAILPDKTESLVGLVHFNGTNTFGGRAYDLRSSSRASLRRGARARIIWPNSGCSVVRLLIVVITAALRPAIVVFVTAHSTPARLKQLRISRFLRERSQGCRLGSGSSERRFWAARPDRIAEAKPRPDHVDGIGPDAPIIPGH